MGTFVLTPQPGQRSRCQSPHPRGPHPKRTPKQTQTYTSNPLLSRRVDYLRGQSHDPDVTTSPYLVLVGTIFLVVDRFLGIRDGALGFKASPPFTEYQDQRHAASRLWDDENR
jgi:hypothetical protein